MQSLQEVAEVVVKVAQVAPLMITKLNLQAAAEVVDN